MPTRGTTSLKWQKLIRNIFQSTCPRGARLPIFADLLAVDADFNPRAHEGHDRSASSECRPHDNFNPRAHEGHDQHPAGQPNPHEISIHVPTRGTTVIQRPLKKILIFQSTCPRGARPIDRYSRIKFPSFQSTCPRGARPGEPRGATAGSISIHVPTRGTTTL